MKWHGHQDQVVPPLLHGLRNETDYIQGMGCGESPPVSDQPNFYDDLLKKLSSVQA